MFSGDIPKLRSIQGLSMGFKRMEPICAAWGLTGEIEIGTHALKAQALIMHRMKSPTAARFVWQRLGRTGQRFLYELLCTNHPEKGVPLARVQKHLALTAIETEAIVRQLKEMYVLEEESVSGYQSAKSYELSTPTDF